MKTEEPYKVKYQKCTTSTGKSSVNGPHTGSPQHMKKIMLSCLRMEPLTKSIAKFTAKQQKS